MNEIEKKAIETAYAGKVSLLFDVLTSNFLTADGIAEKEKEAEESFMRGVKLMKHARDRATALLGT